ncbi:MAG: hypothetical protein AAF763_15565 [Pseudomonadota bacterium]
MTERLPGAITAPAEVAHSTRLRQRRGCWKANCCATPSPQETPETSA